MRDMKKYACMMCKIEVYEVKIDEGDVHLKLCRRCAMRLAKMLQRRVGILLLRERYLEERYDPAI